MERYAVQTVNTQKSIGYDCAAVGAAMCRNALMDEVYTTPKPGLVDRHDTGAHTDMDCDTFRKSADAVAPYLGQMFVQGILNGCRGGTGKSLFRAINETGIAAEEAMNTATDGVNTHKGAIFTLGLIMAATGSCIGKRTGRIPENSGKGFGLVPAEKSFGLSPDEILFGSIPNEVLFGLTSDEILSEIKNLFADAIYDDIGNVLRRAPESFGEKLIHEGNSGIRGEAAAGFPVIADVGLPAYREAMRVGAGYEDVKLHTLLSIMAELNDTCVIKRGSYAGAELVKKEASRILAETEIGSTARRQQLAAMNEMCIRENLSPGGSADMLAAVILINNFFN